MEPIHAIDEAQMRQLREDLLDSMDEDLELELELDDRFGAHANLACWAVRPGVADLAGSVGWTALGVDEFS